MGLEIRERQARLKLDGKMIAGAVVGQVSDPLSGVRCRGWCRLRLGTGRTVAILPRLVVGLARWLPFRLWFGFVPGVVECYQLLEELCPRIQGLTLAKPLDAFSQKVGAT
jgi:hypothetical protein